MKMRLFVSTLLVVTIAVNFAVPGYAVIKPNQYCRTYFDGDPPNTGRHAKCVARTGCIVYAGTDKCGGPPATVPGFFKETELTYKHCFLPPDPTSLSCDHLAIMNNCLERKFYVDNFCLQYMCSQFETVNFCQTPK